MQYDLKSICNHFRLYGDFVSGKPYGSGHINDTYAVTFNQAGTSIRYLLQRINHLIFPDVAALMENIERVTQHVNLKARGKGDSSCRSLTLVYTKDDLSYYNDADGNYWRLYLFIEGAIGHDVVFSPALARAAASAFGRFQNTLADLPGGPLHETIPDFHNTVKRYADFEAALASDVVGRADSCGPEIDFARSRKAITGVILGLMTHGSIPRRATHNDTKLNNVLIGDNDLRKSCVIDLDTLMPGSVLYDFGDLVRTSTSPVAEDEEDLSRVEMQMHMFEALVQGYCEGAGTLLTEKEIGLLPFAGKLITFETGLRFLADYLAGDPYFKTKRNDHNLIRCRTQFALVTSIEQKESEMSTLTAAATKQGSEI